MARLEQDFGVYVHDLLRREKRETQDPELVPDTFLWLIDGNEFIGSRKIIEANGGVLQDELTMEHEGESKPYRRYWIDVS